MGTLRNDDCKLLSKGLGLVTTHSGVKFRLFDSRAHNCKQHQENIKHSINTNSVVNSFGKH